MFSQQLLELQALEQFLHMDAQPSEWPRRDGRLVEVPLGHLPCNPICHAPAEHVAGVPRVWGGGHGARI